MPGGLRYPRAGRGGHSGQPGLLKRRLGQRAPHPARPPTPWPQGALQPLPGAPLASAKDTGACGIVPPRASERRPDSPHPVLKTQLEPD